MTLSLASITQKHAKVVTDRRLSNGSKIGSDEAPKTFALVTPDARVAVSFSGLATAPGFDTHKFLLEAVGKSERPNISINGIVEGLSAKLTAEFSSNSVLSKLGSEQKRLSILLVGFGLQYPHLPICWIISNYEDRPDGVVMSEAREDFRIQYYNHSGGPLSHFCAIGDNSALTRPPLENFVESALSHSRNGITKKLIHFVRKSSDTLAESGRTRSRVSPIGKNLTSICIPSDPAAFIRLDYHVNATKSRFVTPHILKVLPDLSVDAYFEALPSTKDGAPLSVPVVGRNKLCPCKSGLRYRECHGNKTEPSISFK